MKSGQIYEIIHDSAGALGVTVHDGGIFPGFSRQRFVCSRKQQLGPL
jgi:hypothetical protein